MKISVDYYKNNLKKKYYISSNFFMVQTLSIKLNNEKFTKL